MKIDTEKKIIYLNIPGSSSPYSKSESDYLKADVIDGKLCPKAPDMFHLDLYNYINWIPDTEGKEVLSGKYPKICIVRNPYHRFMDAYQASLLTTTKLFYEMNDIKDLKGLVSFIEKNPKKIYDAFLFWFSPSHLYTHKNGEKVAEIIYYEDKEQIDNLNDKYGFQLKYSDKIPKKYTRQCNQFGEQDIPKRF